MTDMTDFSEPLAIVGLATRFPQDASSTDRLWQYLLERKCASTPFPEDRIGSGHFHPDPEHGGTFAVKGAHFLAEDPAYFDAPFFGITKGEAKSLDPQQRVVLENVYSALENSGLALENVAGSNTSVYVSGFNHDHQAIMNNDPEITLRHRVTGLTNSLLSNRVSWFFNFQGPSITIDTACSSSLTALHLGAQSLRTGESDMSVVTGVTIINVPNDVAGMSHQGFLSPDGRCFSFDHRANGFARGEGVGTVIVKRLSDAIRDGNMIRAVLRGSGINQDGKTPGITLPSSEAQERLIRKTYASAGLTTDQTTLVEAHGTGTKQGDAIEARGIAMAFASQNREKPLYLGSVKASVGHLEGAAGVAGLIKSILCLENGIIPPQANFEKPNPKIRFDAWKIKIATQITPWPSEGVRRVSINSFGVGGSNAHAIIDDAYHYLSEHGLSARHHTASKQPSAEEIECLKQTVCGSAQIGKVPESLTNGDSERHVNGVHAHRQWETLEQIETPPQIVGLSAFDEGGVVRNTKTLAGYLSSREHPTSNLSFVRDFAFTLNHRSKLGWRNAVLAKSQSDLVSSLTSLPGKPVRARGTTSIAFVFTGQGAQYAQMGRELHCFKIFRESVEQASSFFQSLGAKWSLLDEMAKQDDSQVQQAWLSQPACTAIQVALIDLLSSWGIYASRVVGHSSGEIAAAYAAGKLSRESAWKVAYFRGVVCAQQTISKGAMAAVALSQADAEILLENLNGKGPGKVVVACINSPRNCTISGDERLIDELCQALQAEGVFARRLNVDKAYHSHHMAEMGDVYMALLDNISPAEPAKVHKAQIFSSVTGAPVGDDFLGPDYWVANLVSPVKFSEAFTATCFRSGSKGQASLRVDSQVGNVFADVVIELGAHGALQSAIKDILASQIGGSAVTSLAVLNRSQPGAEPLLSTIKHLWCRGCPIDLHVVNDACDVGRPADSPSLLVEVPGYTFNHSQRLWCESRLSKNHRLRKTPRHDLFGAPVPDWNVDFPRWRNFLRLEEQPWLRDHVVTNSYVYPGVGYLIAAIEAIRQIADPGLDITAFRLRDISIKRALIVPEEKEGIEVMLSMNRVDESSVASSSIWRRFQIASYNPIGDEWIEHCTGYIAVDYNIATGPVDAGRELREEEEARRQVLRDAESRCQGAFDITHAYENMAVVGLKFGPLFRNGSQTTGTGNQGGAILGRVTVPDIAKTMPKEYLYEHMIHPATFDSMMHFALGAIMDLFGGQTLQGPAVPTFIKDAWISAKLNPQPGHKYRVHGRTERVAFEKYDSDVLAWDEESGDGRIFITGIRATPLDSADQRTSTTRGLCHELKWVPDMETFTLSDVQKVKENVPHPDALTSEWVERLQLATLLLIDDALEELDKAPVEPEGHLLRYLDWLRQLRQWMQEDKIEGLRLAKFEEFRSDPALKAKLYAQVEAYKAEGRLAVRMGSNIVSVLRKEADPLHLMFGMDDILDHVYADLVNLGELPDQQKRYLETLGDNYTNLRVLEVGAGTGSSTKAIIESLIPLDGDDQVVRSSVATYTYTDISAGFFEKAREKFKAYQVFEYKTLNAEHDVAGQGFEMGSYDLIVAQNVIHATGDLVTTLTNLRKLLKPGGRFIIQEGIRQDYFWSALAFGQLPGWWLGSEPIRKWSPFITSVQWDEHLKLAGFSGVEVEMPSSHDPALHTQSLLVTRAVDEKAVCDFPWKKVVLIRGEDSAEAHTGLVSKLQAELGSDLGPTTVLDFAKMKEAEAELSQSLCILLAELHRPILANLTAEEYEGLRQMLTVCKGLLYVTGDMVRIPEFGMATGLIRTVKWERDLDDVNLVTLSVADTEPSDALAYSVAKLCRSQFAIRRPKSDQNGEYILNGDKLLTSRLHKSTGADGFLKSKFSPPKPVLTAWKDAGRPVKLSSSSPGLLSRLEWVTDPVYKTPLDPFHVEIEVKAMGLNFRDLMIAMGEHMAYSIGCEASGIISRIGAEVTDVRVGDRVTYITGLDHVGCFHTYGRVHQGVVTKIPDELSYEEAAGLPAVYVTVLYALRDVAHLSRGEKVLIHAAAGGVGQAAINYAKHVGAEIFATVSTPEKADILIREHGIERDHIFSSRDTSFAKGIKRMTGGEGVDVILNSLAGEALRCSWALLAPFGRFIEIGKKDIQSNSKIELRPLLHATSMTCVDLVTMMKRRPALVKRLTDDTVKLWSEGVVKPAKPTTVRPLSELVEGFQLLQSGKGVGKMVFVPQPDDRVPMVPPQPAEFRLRPDAAYVLSGGLGGLGRSIARWMASRGARHFLFLSSSGNITASVSEMKRDLESIGCKIHIAKCDVSDGDRVKTVVEEFRSILPPIKGVVQGAMKLDDSIFENMTYDAWQAAIKPKVAGSWNLHQHLPPDLDHFVMLSSATGILGNRGQANYASGNTYQDMLAYHRRQQGLVASTIDVGAILSVGYVAENSDRVAINNKGINVELEQIREEELHAMIEYAMDSRHQGAAQLVTGLTAREKYQAKGMPLPSFMSFPLFAHLNAESHSGGGGATESMGQAVEAQLRTARTLEEASGMVASAVRAKLAALLSVGEDDIDTDKSVSANGIDSLVAIEFRTFLVRDLRADVPMLDVMGTSSIKTLSKKIASLSQAVEISDKQAKAE